MNTIIVRQKIDESLVNKKMAFYQGKYKGNGVRVPRQSSTKTGKGYYEYVITPEEISDWDAFSEEIRPLIVYADYMEKIFCYGKEVSGIPFSDFKDAIEMIGATTEMKPAYYHTKGDISEVRKQGFGYFLTVTEGQNAYQSLEVLVPTKVFEEAFADTDPNVLKKRAIEFIGYSYIYAPHAKIQLKARQVQDAGWNSRIKAEAVWRREHEEWLCSSDVWTEFEPPQKIGLVSSGNSQGGMDFIKHLKYHQEEKLMVESVNLKHAAEIAEAIQTLQDKGCEAICLVRGGGNSEDLFIFSDPAILEAIWRARNAGILVVAGIGHDNDEVLSNEVASVDGGTPTGAAEKLNYLAGKHRRKGLNAAVEIRYSSEKKEKMTWQEKYEAAKKENALLKSLLDNQDIAISELQQELEKYQNSRKKQSFWHRLLGD